MDRTALVLGGASCVWDDAAAALDLFEPALIVACNDIGAAWAGRVDIWCSLHPDKFTAWRALREARGFATAGEHFGHEAAPGVDIVADYRWPGMNASGSSGLFAVKLALDAGATHVALCGVPMAPAGAHFFDAQPWVERDSFTSGWKAAMPYIAGKVRSFSGWTMELLGRPSPAWLAGDPRP